MLIEVPVLGGHDGVFHHVGDLVERHLDAVLSLVQLGELAALRIADDRRLRLRRLGWQVHGRIGVDEERHDDDGHTEGGNDEAADPLPERRLREPRPNRALRPAPASPWGRHCHTLPVGSASLGALPP